MGATIPVAVHRAVILVASLVVEHGLSCVGVSGVVAHGLSGSGSQALEHRLSSCGACA